jgi:cytochrome c biogenesis protein CcmG, thiol:disulfide interchange protein DsbE
MQKFLPFLILIFLVSLFGLSIYKLNKKHESAQDASSASKIEDSEISFTKTHIILPEFSLPDLFNENQNFSKKDLLGKYSIINFFASWCTTCRAEHEVLLRLQSEKIIDIYGIAWRDIDDNTKAYLKESGNPFTKIGKDGKALFTKITGIEAVPETLIVDPKGNVVMRYRGNLQDFSIDEIREFLRKNQ